jgi:branched-chain amino acid transport system ATP-binding protein
MVCREKSAVTRGLLKLIWEGGIPVLKIDNLNVSYQEISALKGVSLQVHEGEIVSLIGGNGAGKTTLLKSISRLLPIKKGTIEYNGQQLSKFAPYDMIKLGLVHVPEGRHVFSNMTVKENLGMGAYSRRDKKGIAESYDKVYTLFPRLYDRRDQSAGTMSGGEQQMLAIGRALMATPKLLMLDEPSMGLAPLVVENLFETIVEINRQGITVLLVEQNAFLSLQIAQRAYVIETGNITMEGTGESLLHDDRVRQTYLGEE